MNRKCSVSSVILLTTLPIPMITSPPRNLYERKYVRNVCGMKRTSDWFVDRICFSCYSKLNVFLSSFNCPPSNEPTEKTTEYGVSIWISRRVSKILLHSGSQTSVEANF